MSLSGKKIKNLLRDKTCESCCYYYRTKTGYDLWCCFREYQPIDSTCDCWKNVGVEIRHIGFG